MTRRREIELMEDPCTQGCFGAKGIGAPDERGRPRLCVGCRQRGRCFLRFDTLYRGKLSGWYSRKKIKQQREEIKDEDRNDDKRALCFADVPPMKPLLSVLREDLGFKGSKEGCGEGECGACSVMIDGRLVNACLVPAVQASGCEILTIEGLGSPDNMDLLQKAFVSEGGVQCGFCTPGMVMAARALLEENPTPTRDEIKLALSGNICRCTGYEKIYNAVEKAVQDGYCDTFRTRENLCSGQAPTPSSESDKNCFAPEDLNEAFEILDGNSDVSILAGSTDIIPDIKNGKYSFKKIMDLSRVKELKGINKVGDTIRIGSCHQRRHYKEQHHQKVSSGPLGSCVQKRSACCAEQGNNWRQPCDCLGAADLPTVLLPLDAGVVTEGSDGAREMKLEKFIIGYREPDLSPTR